MWYFNHKFESVKLHTYTALLSWRQPALGVQGTLHSPLGLAGTSAVVTSCVVFILEK